MIDYQGPPMEYYEAPTEPDEEFDEEGNPIDLEYLDELEGEYLYECRMESREYDEMYG